ncbi:b165ec75-d9ef-49ad-af7f-f074c688d52e [Thermothielavioides terrestris]|uniref:B165ec75-d9ef-49ad-af7f-f074c688d52e n=1 Tax=Thermothielavioides terrestris TaxID=2587410 RepID=A0A446BS92_9PEZI|nr:b165ec75-d9ef-49ad-af7f-f074c688d52e [Thermothielavioides terrestris]
MDFDAIELTQHEVERPEPPPKPTRIFIACTRCKVRKNRCDGGKPSCGNCLARGALCEYPTVRKTRGPGKKFRSEHTKAVCNPVR